jgi:hypothetical protein
MRPARPRLVVVAPPVVLGPLAPAGVEGHHKRLEARDRGSHDAAVEQHLGADDGVDDREQDVGAVEGAVDVYLAGDGDYNYTGRLVVCWSADRQAAYLALMAKAKITAAFCFRRILTLHTR